MSVRERRRITDAVYVLVSEGAKMQQEQEIGKGVV